MGRELKRVPLDFAWPLNKTWKGFISPLYVATKCEVCDGSGSSPEARRLKDRWYGYAPFHPSERGSVTLTPADAAVRAFAERNVLRAPDYYGSGEVAIIREAKRLCAIWNRQWCHHLNADDVAALVAAGRLNDLTSDFTPGVGWRKKEPFRVPTPQEVNVWSISGFGHDAINQWVCVRAECERVGVAVSCTDCGGEGDRWPSAEAKQAYEDWQKCEPPQGEGYQIWETVSEGSPISPVFSTPEDLAKHMATTQWGADKGTPYATWLAFIRGPGWAPSMVVTATGVHDGVSAAVEMAAP